MSGMLRKHSDKDWEKSSTLQRQLLFTSVMHSVGGKWVCSCEYAKKIYSCIIY